MDLPNLPTIPDDKLNYYREQLYRELSHMFRWEGLPQTIPHDYLERTLVREGQVLFYEHPIIGLDVLAAQATGYNRHNMPTQAQAIVKSTVEGNEPIIRNIKRLTDSELVEEEFNPENDGVLIYNMENGQSAKMIVEHFAQRLVLAQLAFDTNLLWQMRPYIFAVDNKDLKFSIEKLFRDIYSGKPFAIVDKSLGLLQEQGNIKIEVPFIADKLMDLRNEIMMKFRETVGISTPGVDKAERVNTLEVSSNVQHTKTVLQIMLEQRQIAAENINAFFGTNISVSVVGADEMQQIEDSEKEGVLEDDDENNGSTSTPIAD